MKRLALIFVRFGFLPRWNWYWRWIRQSILVRDIRNPEIGMIWLPFDVSEPDYLRFAMWWQDMHAREP